MSINTITKATARGQITIPKIWRDRFQTNNYLLRADDFKLEITPVDKEEIEWLGADVIFSAERDNGGHGIETGRFIKILRALNKNEQNRKTARSSRTKRSAKN